MSAGSRPRRERGAAAVEMAIVLPLLLLVLGGIVDLGRALYGEVIVTNAAREGARMVAMNYSNAQADVRVTAALPGITPLNGGVAPTVSYVRCPASPSPTSGAQATVTAANFSWAILGPISNLFGTPIAAPDLTARSEMRCLG
jgi:Flp pilus assembly protein TadG